MIYDTNGVWCGYFNENFYIGKPIDLCYEDDSDIMIIIKGTYEFEITDMEEGCVDEFGSYGDGKGEFLDISSVTCQDGLIFITDAESSRVSVFDADGDYVRHFGARYLEEPNGITIGGPNNHVYVSDNDRDDVCVFSWQGQFLRSFGENIDAGASGITVDSEGFVSVCRPKIDIVQVYRPDGEFYCSFGKPGSRPGSLNNPQGMELLPDGRLVVCDCGNNRVQIF